MTEVIMVTPTEDFGINEFRSMFGIGPDGKGILVCFMICHGGFWGEQRALLRLSNLFSRMLFGRGTSLQKTRITELHLRLTNRCNLRCYFCPVVTHSGEARKELSVDCVEKFIDKVSLLSPNLKSVVLTGGEPLLHSKFLKVVEIVRSRGYGMRLLTNGVFLQRINEAGLLGGFSSVFVSLHSIDHYEEVFGTSNKKIKEQVLSGLLSLDKDVKRRISLSVALTRYGEIDDVISFARSNGFQINLFPIRNFRRAYDLTYGISEEAVAPRIEEIVKKNRDIISSPCSHTIKKLTAVNNSNFSWSMPCTMPHEMLILDQEGKVRLCCGDQPAIGKATDFPEILDNYVCRRILFEANRRLGVCRNCAMGVDPCLKCIGISQIINFAKRNAAQFLFR